MLDIMQYEKKQDTFKMKLLADQLVEFTHKTNCSSTWHGRHVFQFGYMGGMQGLAF